jgi:hypothetical protein
MLNWLKFWRFFVFPPETCGVSTFIEPRPLPFRIFPIHHSPFNLTSPHDSLKYWRWTTIPESQFAVSSTVVEASWNVMAHAQKPDLVFRRNGQVCLNLILLMWRIKWAPNNASKWLMGFISAFKGLNRWERQFSRLLAAEVCASAVEMLDKPCPEVVRSVLATHSIRQFPLHFPSRASPCAITFQLESNTSKVLFALILRHLPSVTVTHSYDGKYSAQLRKNR